MYVFPSVQNSKNKRTVNGYKVVRFYQPGPNSPLPNSSFFPDAASPEWHELSDLSFPQCLGKAAAQGRPSSDLLLLVPFLFEHEYALYSSISSHLYQE